MTLHALPGDVRPEAAPTPTDAPASSSASKTLTLLKALSRAPDGPHGVTEIARLSELPKSTVHRLLKILEEHGFVAREGAQYRLGNDFFELSLATHWSEYGTLRDVATRPLAWMFERADAMAVHLAILRGPNVVYLDKLSRPEGARLPSRIGGRFPATCTALGKAMLAFSDRALVDEVVSGPLARPTPYSVAERRRLYEQLDQTRVTGYALEREEACHGTVCIAAPIVQDGHAIAALSLCVQTYGISHAVPDRTAGYGKLAVEAASTVTRLLTAR